MKYILEPMLLAVNKESSQDEFEDYVDHLLEWKDWLADHSHEIYMLSNTDEYLQDTGNYPDVSVVKMLVKKYHLDHVDINDVNKTIRMLIDSSIKIDDICDEYEYVCEKVKVENEPDCIKDREFAFQESMFLILWYAYCMSLVESKDVLSSTVFLSGISATLRLNILYSDLTGTDILEAKAKCQMCCKSSLCEFWSDDQSPYILFKQAESRDDIALGVLISTYQYEGLLLIDEAYKKYDFNVQPSFYDDYKACYQSQDGYTRKIITSMTTALAESILNISHPLREGKQPTKPDKVRKGYLAERRDCTRGVHTHYWKKGCRLLFANVGEHDDMEISNPYED